jgi:hypothetical protein
MKYKQNCKTRTKKGGASELLKTELLKTKEMGASLVSLLGNEQGNLQILHDYHSGLNLKVQKKWEINEEFIKYISTTLKINDDIKKYLNNLNLKAYELNHEDNIKAQEDIKAWTVQKILDQQKYLRESNKIFVDYNKLKAAALEKEVNDNNKRKENNKKKNLKKKKKRNERLSADNNNNNPTFPVGGYDKVESDDEEVDLCRCSRCLELEEEEQQALLAPRY